jgi:uncharacterized protein YdeI (YjbR/CyaY-like superfamily)
LNPSNARSFETPGALDQWLGANHAIQTELWVRIFKKDSGTATVDWKDCVVAALTWGWIDGQRRSLDEVSFLLRLTPRRSGSNWSKKNCEHAERLIADGRMQPSGLKQVEAARQDGRWERAYSGSAAMVIPEEFLRELRKNAPAKQLFETLDRRDLFAIYLRLQTAKHPETRKKRIMDIEAKLGRGERFH